MLGSRLYNTYIPANAHVKKSKELGLPIHLIGKISKSSSRGAMAFRILAKNILKDAMPELFVENSEQEKGLLRRIADTYQPQPGKREGDRKPAADDEGANPLEPIRIRVDSSSGGYS